MYYKLTRLCFFLFLLLCIVASLCIFLLYLLLQLFLSFLSSMLLYFVCDVGHWYGAFLCYFDLFFVKVFLCFVGYLILLCFCPFTTLLQLGVCSFQFFFWCDYLYYYYYFQVMLMDLCFYKWCLIHIFLVSVVSFSKYLFIMLYTWLSKTMVVLWSNQFLFSWLKSWESFVLC